MISYLLAIYWTICVLATHVPMPSGSEEFLIWDKAVHTTMFFGLGLLLGWRLTAGERKFHTVFVLGLVILACYGAVDELTQPFTGRSTDIFDWLADMLGATAGLLVSRSSLGRTGSRIFGDRGRTSSRRK